MKTPSHPASSAAIAYSSAFDGVARSPIDDGVFCRYNPWFSRSDSREAVMI